jgi:hypothetical protein
LITSKICGQIITAMMSSEDEALSTIAAGIQALVEGNQKLASLDSSIAHASELMFLRPHRVMDHGDYPDNEASQRRHWSTSLHH